jgi:hypothetical protein
MRHAKCSSIRISREQGEGNRLADRGVPTNRDGMTLRGKLPNGSLAVARYFIDIVNISV